VPASRRRTLTSLLLALVALIAVAAPAANAITEPRADDLVTSEVFDAGGTLYATADGPDGGLYSTVRYASDGSWHGPFAVGATGTTYSTPSQLFASDGTLYVAAEGPDHSLVVTVRYASDGSWHGPYTIAGAGTTYSTPTMVFASDGTLFVAARGPSNSLTSTVRYASDGSWHGPYTVGAAGTTYSTPTQAFASDGTLFVTARGPSNSLTSTVRYASDGSWHGPFTVGAAGTTYSTPSSTFRSDGTLFVVAKGPSHSLMSTVRYASDGSWNGPFTSGTAGTTFSAPSLIFASDNTLFVSAQGVSNTLASTVRYASDGSWHGPFTVGSIADTGIRDETPPTATVTGGLYDARTAASLTSGALSVAADDNYSGATMVQLLEVAPSGARTVLAQGSRTCPNDCDDTAFSWSTTFEPDAAGWATGMHQLEVKVFDDAGNNQVVQAWGVHYYKSSWDFGGANHAVDTDTERVALLASADAATAGTAGPLMDGLTPADLAGLEAYSNANTDDSDTLEMGSVEPMTADERTAYGVDSDAAHAAAFGTYGCRNAVDVRTNRINLVFKKIERFTSTLTVRFCWNKPDHIVGLAGDPPQDTRTDTVTVPGWASALGVSANVYSLEDTPSSQYRTFGGYPRGELAMTRWFDVHGCWFEGPLGCAPQDGLHEYHSIYAHWDGTATGQYGSR
jgi:uncharacterized protein (DUF2147 family)